MWETLASEHRAWDVLEAVTSRRWKLGRLYDEYTRVGGNVADLRRRLNDVDLATLRDGFLLVYDKQVRNEDTRKRMRRHLADLFEAPLLASHATHELLTARLYEYGDVSPNTLRTVHASWSEFFDYALHVKHVVPTDPMDRVPRPPREKLPPRFYELDVIHQIVEWQPTEKRAALMAVVYGTGLEISVALAITRGDIDPSKKSIRSPGTKAHTRDRVVRVDDWAWPIFWKYAKTITLTTSVIFGDLNRWTASDWHRNTVGDGEPGFANQWRSAEPHEGLKLETRYPMYNARHAWAARTLRAGVPVEGVQKQLGHVTAKETFDTYGQFCPDAADRDAWQRQVAKAEKRRRKT
jgi:integrase